MRVRFSVFTLIVSLLIPQFVAAQTPAVSPSELHRAVTAAAENRQKNLDDVRSFFSSDPVRSALRTGRVDYRKVDKAVAALSSDELARLATRTNQLQKDFAAGALTNQELTYIRTFAFRGEWADLQQRISKGRPLVVCLELWGYTSGTANLTDDHLEHLLFCVECQSLVNQFIDVLDGLPRAHPNQAA